ncbi:recombinase family protein [Streptomyces sp. B1866]|uniref:recombinase family protein n=1 Tax=Streptomyces sp. B1866 TaxID=3075431 RepID=UPI00288E668A|nr:recombinase family protein [Streptomyces sp. B1866]MDT3399314.1 recombinase family protein [Streptomyces sp. B1866]
MSDRGVSGPERAACLVFGAREADEPDGPSGGPSVYRQFEKDWDAQTRQCARLAAERGYERVGSTVVSAVQPSLPRLLDWADDPGCEVVLVASDRLLARIRDVWPDWDLMVDHLRAAGARVEAVPYAEPVYPGERPAPHA